MAQIDVLSTGPPLAYFCGAAGTVTNRGPDTVYYRDELPVSAAVNDGLIAVSGTAVLSGQQYFAVAAGNRARLQVPDVLLVATSGIPVGGSTGQFLKKNSSADSDAVWTDGTPLETTAPGVASGTGSAGTASTAAHGDHTHPSGVLLPSGIYVPHVHDEGSTYTLVLGLETIIGFDLAPQTIDRIGFRVTTAGSAGAVIRVGIRADSGQMPGTPQTEQTVAVTTTGEKETTALAYAHPGGILWVSMTGQGWSVTAPIVAGTSASVCGWCRPWAMAHFNTLANASSGSTGALDYLAYGNTTATIGALPSSFTSSGSRKAMQLWIKRA